jgi:hypothetical protein
MSQHNFPVPQQFSLFCRGDVHPLGETRKLGTDCDGAVGNLLSSSAGPRLVVWLSRASRERARPP